MIRFGWVLRVVAMFFLVAAIIFFALISASAISRGLPVVRIASPIIFLVMALTLLAVTIRAHVKAAPPPPAAPAADTLRVRAGSIGCGAVTFAFSGVWFAMALGSILALQFSGASIGALIVGVVLCVATLLFWLNAVRSITDDDDLFSGTRGAAFSIIVVTFLVITIAWIFLGMQGDFWRGFLGSMQEHP